VLNKNFDGFKGNIQFGDTGRGDYRDLSGSVAWGSDVLGGKGHIVLSADYDLRPDLVLQGSENWFSNSYVVSNPAYVAGNGQPQMILANDVGLADATAGGLIISSPKGTSAAANALRGIQFVGNGIAQLVNFGNVSAGILSNDGSLGQNDSEVDYSFIGVPLTKYTLFAFGRYKLTDTIQASLQLNYGYTTGKNFGQPGVQTGLVIQSDNAYIPASVKAAMTAGGITSFTMGIVEQNGFPSNVSGDQYFNTAERSLGPSITTNQHELERGVFTLEGTLGSDWSWNAYYQHSSVRYWSWAWSDDLLSNLALAEDAVSVTTANRGTSNLPLGSIACRSTLTAPTNGCIPLNVFGINTASAQALAYIAPPHANHLDQQLNQDEAAASMQGTLPWELPAGKVAVVFGAGYRKEAAVATADPRGLTAQWSTGNWSNFPSSDYFVYEGFGEVDAPLLKNNIVNSLDFTAAGRITSYSTSGMVETWKLGLTSQVTDDFKLRTTLSEDIRAPELNDLFALAAQSSSQTIDPKTGLPVSISTNTIGNPNLKPEEARTVSAGIVLTPHWIDGLQASVDYYSIDLTKALGTISSATILATCTTNINDPLCTRLIFNGPNGALRTITQFTVNIAEITTSGFDIQANYSMDFWDGTLALQTTDTYMDELTQSQPGTLTNDYAGVIAGTGGALNTAGTPKWKGTVAATYLTGPYSVTVQSRWFGTGIINNQWNTGNLANAAGGIPNAVPQYLFHLPLTAYLDLRGNYKWNDNISFYSAIDNALDTPPPYVLMSVRSTVHPQATATTTYDMLGRQFRLGVRFSY
jgi:outer membrane receptor protein involved in Fe transport